MLSSRVRELRSGLDACSTMFIAQRKQHQTIQRARFVFNFWQKLARAHRAIASAGGMRRSEFPRSF